MALKLPNSQVSQSTKGVDPKDATKTTVFEDIENVVGNGLNMGGLFIGFSSAFASFLASAFTGLGKAGGKIGIKSAEKWGKSKSNNITNFTDSTFEDVLGGNNKTMRGIGKIAGSAGNSAGDALNKVTDKLGVSYIAKASDARAKNFLDELAKLSKEASGRNSKLANHAKKLINSVGNTDHAEISEAFSKAIKDSKLNKKDGKIFTKILYTAEKANKSHVNASYFRKPGNLLKNLTGAIGKAKVLPGLANLTFIVLSVTSIVSVVNNLIKNFGALKEMSKDITGKETSTLDILLGKVPEPVKEARSKLLKNSIISGATDAISLGLNVSSAVKGNVSAIGFLAPQMAGMGLSTLIGESALPKYTELSQAHATGQKISAEDYAGLIGMVSPEIQARGGSDSVFAKELGKIYEAEKASPAQIMREASNGKLVKHVQALIAANEAAKATAGTHVAALQKPSAKIISPENKPVLGNHTAQLVANASQAQATLALSGASNAK